MANRIAIYDRQAVNDVLSIVSLSMPEEWFAERYNIAPLSAVWAVVIDTVTPKLRPAQWGLIPPWAKPDQFARPLTHARSETVWEKASFKSLIRRYRGLMICDGFYIFKGRGTQAKVYYVSRPEQAIALGVVWQYNVDGNTEVALLNTAEGTVATSLASRAPVVITNTDLDEWLTSDKSGTINRILDADGSRELVMREVTNYVRDPLNEGTDCLISAGD